uniref:(northern house mosquito) hypothetical protein n=1 Tax=Culex pipiens TaxID=7175 RepID=A0A8D8F0E8_CULPI
MLRKLVKISKVNVCKRPVVPEFKRATLENAKVSSLCAAPRNVSRNLLSTTLVAVDIATIRVLCSKLPTTPTESHSTVNSPGLWRFSPSCTKPSPSSSVADR